VTFTYDLSTPKLGYPRSFLIPSLNTLGSFVFELCCGKTDKLTDRQTDRQTDGLYKILGTNIVSDNQSFAVTLCNPIMANDRREEN